MSLSFSDLPQSIRSNYRQEDIIKVQHTKDKQKKECWTVYKKGLKGDLWKRFASGWEIVSSIPTHG
jgi:hypothetical protein